MYIKVKVSILNTAALLCLTVIDYTNLKIFYEVNKDLWVIIESVHLSLCKKKGFVFVAIQ